MAVVRRILTVTVLACAAAPAFNATAQALPSDPVAPGVPSVVVTGPIRPPVVPTAFPTEIIDLPDPPAPTATPTQTPATEPSATPTNASPGRGNGNRGGTQPVGDRRPAAGDGVRSTAEVASAQAPATSPRPADKDGQMLIVGAFCLVGAALAGAIGVVLLRPRPRPVGR